MTRVNVLGEGAIFWNLELKEALFQTPKGFSSSSLTFDWLFLTGLLSSFMCMTLKFNPQMMRVTGRLG